MDLRFVVSRLHLAKESMSLPNHLASVHSMSICHGLCLIRRVHPQLPSPGWLEPVTCWVVAITLSQWERIEIEKCSEPAVRSCLFWGIPKMVPWGCDLEMQGNWKTRLNGVKKNGPHPKCYESSSFFSSPEKIKDPGDVQEIILLSLDK